MSHLHTRNRKGKKEKKNREFIFEDDLENQDSFQEEKKEEQKRESFEKTQQKGKQQRGIGRIRREKLPSIIEQRNKIDPKDVLVKQTYKIRPKDALMHFRKERENEVSKEDSQIMKKIKKRLLHSKEEAIIRSSIEQMDLREIELNSSLNKIAGNISVIWLFLIGSYVQKPKVENIEYIPFLYNIEELSKFLAIEKTYFKIVVIPDFLEQVLQEYENYSRIIDIIVYFPGEQKKEKRKLLKIKRKHKKVKEICSKLEKVLNKASNEMDDDILQLKKKYQKSLAQDAKMKLPTYIALSGADKEEATNYRINLYASIKMLDQERAYRYLDFMDIAYQKYSKDEEQINHIRQYINLRHFSGQFDEERCKKILNFWTKQSFYYKMLNNGLRVSKSPQQFQKWSLPLNQTYQAVKHFYHQQLKKNKNQIKQMTLYRGAKLSQKALKQLKSVLVTKVEEGEEVKIDHKEIKPIYLETYGFLATSKDLPRAKYFADESRIIFVIHISKDENFKSGLEYDHGFVDLNQFQIPIKEMIKEKQVLFNPLNVFKVFKAEEKIQKGNIWTYIHLEYGSIQILRKKKYQIKLSAEEQQVLMNYEYCATLERKIEDLSDVFILANQPQFAKDYLEMKVETAQNQKDLIKYHSKLAQAHKQLGELNKAQDNTGKALEACERNKSDESERQKCLKVLAIHRQCAQTRCLKEDWIGAEQAQNKALDQLKKIERKEPEDQIKEGSIHRSIGEIKFKCGQILKAEEKFAVSSDILQGLLSKATVEREQLRNKYFWDKLKSFICCNFSELPQIDQDVRQKEKEINDKQKKINEIKDQIIYELNKLNTSMKEVSLYARNKYKYQKYVKKGFQYLAQMKISKTKDPFQKAELKVMQATLNSFFELAKSEKLINEAIELIENNVSTGHPLIGEYSGVIAKIQKNHLEKRTSGELLIQVKQGAQNEQDHQSKLKMVQYDPKEEKKIAEKCEKNYERAINILLYNNKSSKSRQVLQLKKQLSDLKYDLNNFKQCEEVLQQILQEVEEGNDEKVVNSQVSNAYFLYSKISYSRGQMKLAFHYAERAEQILREALVKQENQAYKAYFKKQDLRIQISLHKVRIFHKQLKHDQSLSTLEEEKEIVQEKFRHSQGNPYSVDILVFMGEAYCQQGQKDKFIKYFTEAIAIQKQQSGCFTPQMAQTLCTFAFNHLLIRPPNLTEAKTYLEKSFQSLQGFPLNHPKRWPLHFCNARLQLLCNKPQNSLKLLELCLNILVRSFDHEHITISKVRQSYLESLISVQRKTRSSEQYRQSFKLQFSKLRQDIEDDIRKTKRRFVEVQKKHQVALNEVDDEKVRIQKNLEVLLESHQSIVREEQSSRMQIRSKSQ